MADYIKNKMSFDPFRTSAAKELAKKVVDEYCADGEDAQEEDYSTLVWATDMQKEIRERGKKREERRQANLQENPPRVEILQEEVKQPSYEEVNGAVPSGPPIDEDGLAVQVVGSGPPLGLP